MKKLLFSLAVLLLSLPTHAQEADEFGNYAEFTITPRLEFNGSYNPDEGFGFDLGNSSIYTLFEGQYENFSWTLANHWINAGGDYAWPYTSLGYSNTTNFIDYCLASYSIGDWTISAGKDMIRTGGLEFDEWDWDVHTTFATPLWQTLASYQWGISVDWAANETNSLALQAVTSPFGEYPFRSNMFAYSAQWRYENDFITTLASASALQNTNDEYDYLFAVGARARISGKTALSLDWNNAFGAEAVFAPPVGSSGSDYSYIEGRLLSGSTVKAVFEYCPGSRYDLNLYFLNSFKDAAYEYNFSKFGLVFQYYPLEDSDALRLHATLAYDTLYGAALNVGARFNINILQ